MALSKRWTLSAVVAARWRTRPSMHSNTKPLGEGSRAQGARAEAEPEALDDPVDPAARAGGWISATRALALAVGLAASISAAMAVVTWSMLTLAAAGGAAAGVFGGAFG